eukprot:jgi/Picsp_1/6364/NSC_03713-R1_8-amino-7-oxononanoate synthase
MNWEEWIQCQVEKRQSQQLFRSLHAVDLGSLDYQNNSISTINLNFALNDYLGLSSHPLVRRAASQAALAFGNGPRSSPLVGGYSREHRYLEEMIRKLKKTEEALLFSSGYAANTCLLSALSAGGGVEIFSDELNHASIVDGIRLGGSCNRRDKTLLVYRHNDIGHLRRLLEDSYKRKSSNCRRIVVTDSLFSMDGDYAKLPEIVNLKREFPFLLIIDEAHATLVCGENGGGAAEMLQVEHDVDIHLGTLSKAIGSQGGFIACSRSMKSFIVNVGRSLIYSTALTVPSVVSAQVAIKIGQEESWRREHLNALSRQIFNYCVEHDKNLISPDAFLPSPIVVYGVDDPWQAVAVSKRLLSNHGMVVPGIRPPTVPSSRLRISLSALHTSTQVIGLMEALSSVDICRGLSDDGTLHISETANICTRSVSKSRL